MGLSGNDAELRKLTSALRELSKTGLDDATKTVSVGVEREYLADFAAKRSPFGDAWAPNSTGNATGELTWAMISTTPTVAKGTVKMAPPKYWGYFQSGAPGGKNPRPILPFGPSAWDAPIQADVEKLIAKKLSGTGEG